jgi:hypothetical protein
MDAALRSSVSAEWGTPPAFVAALALRYGAFDLDPCARLQEFAKAPRFYAPAETPGCAGVDGLTQPWSGHVWGNFPWTKANPIDDWIDKALTSECVATLLVPARTDTSWFRRLFDASTEVLFVVGRLSYVRIETTSEREARHAAWWLQKQVLEAGASTSPSTAKALRLHGAKPRDTAPAPFPSAVCHLRPGELFREVGLISNKGELL